MREISDIGIIWKIKPYTEKDMLLTVFTQQHGYITLLAKGVRNTKSKRSGLLQLFSQITFTRTVPKQEPGLSRLLHTQLLRDSPARNPIILTELTLLAEVSLQFLEAHHAVPEVFQLWHKFLQLSFSKPHQEVCGFLIKFFCFLGVFPAFQKCTKCNTKFTEQSVITWQKGSGLFCECTEILDTTSAQRLRFIELKTLFFFEHTSPQNFGKVQLAPQQQDRLFQIIFAEIEMLTSKKFVSKEIFENLIHK